MATGMLVRFLIRELGVVAGCKNRKREFKTAFLGKSTLTSSSPEILYIFQLVTSVDARVAPRV